MSSSLITRLFCLCMYDKNTTLYTVSYPSRGCKNINVFSGFFGDQILFLVLDLEVLDLAEEGLGVVGRVVLNDLWGVAVVDGLDGLG